MPPQGASDYEPCIVRAELEIVDDRPFDLRSERSQDVRYQIVGERPFLLLALHEHRDRRPNALIDEDDESLFLVARETAKAVPARSYGTDVHFDNRLTHCKSPFAFTPGSELLSAPLATQRLLSGGCEQPVAVEAVAESRRIDRPRCRPSGWYSRFVYGIARLRRRGSFFQWSAPELLKG